MSREDLDLWSYSLRVYQDAAVESSCLEMQARWKADVNLILFCCWYACSGRGVMTAGHVKQLISATHDLQHTVVRRLRLLRLRIKKLSLPHARWQQWYQQVLGAELEAERLEQRLLETHPSVGSTNQTESAAVRLQNARQNLLLYLRLIGVQDSEQISPVDHLLSALFC